MNLSERWRPRLVQGGEPIYRQIARALASDIRAGVLAPGTPLPPHRELASSLSVTVSTVTKAYKEVARLNLVSARARAGTKVVHRTAAVVGWRGVRPDGSASIDLASNSVGTERFLQELAAAIPSLSASPRFADLQEYPPVAGLPYHRAAVAQWLRGRGIQAGPDQIVLTGGAHQAIAAVLSAMVHESVTLLAEEYTYAPLGPLAHALRMRIAPVRMDAGGLIPEELESACRRFRRALIFVTPSINNPTTASLDIERRRALIAIARRHNARILEDDVFSLLDDGTRPTLAAMAPERVFQVSSFAKSIAPGLRMGFVVAPTTSLSEGIAASVGLSTRMAPPIYAELTCQWMEDGTLTRLVGAHRNEMGERVRIAREELVGLTVRAASHGPHVWLSLPPRHQEDDVVARAFDLGALVQPSVGFSLRGERCEALRITLTGPRSREELRHGLRLVRQAISET